MTKAGSTRLSDRPGPPGQSRRSRSLKEFLAGQRTYYKANPDEAKKLIHVGLAPPPRAG